MILIISDRFVYFSTDEVFGPAPAGVIYAEYDRYNSGNPYAAAKVSLLPSLFKKKSKKNPQASHEQS